MTYRNELGQPIGAPVDWTPVEPPARVVLKGQYCTVAPLSVDHAADLYDAFSADETGGIWTYLFSSPPASAEAFAQDLSAAAKSTDPMWFTVLVDGKAVGMASLMRIDPAHGVIEVGGINFSPALQRTVASTEAMYLMMRHAFDSGYRRYEWKCNDKNEPSKRAALRLGFTYEGTFRQHMVVKGRNRDTAWFSLLDSEWPAVRARFERWLSPDNFVDGQQVKSLESFG